MTFFHLILSIHLCFYVCDEQEWSADLPCPMKGYYPVKYYLNYVT